MTTAYPVERSARVSNAAAFNGVDDTFGPFTFEIFDALDVVVEIRDIGEDYWLPTTAVTVNKGPETPDHFTITFDAVQPDTKEFRVRGARIHERSISLSKGTGLNMDALARVHAEIAFTLQELRRDADVLNNAAALEAASQAIAAAEAATAALEDVQEAQDVVTQLKADVILLKAAVDQAKTDAEDAVEQAVLNASAVLGTGRVPVGFMIPWHGLKAPNQYWVLVDTVGQVFSRSLFPALLDVFAPEFEVSYSDGNAVVTGIDCPQTLKAGWPVEGENIPPGTTILTVDSPSQITLTANPTGDGTAIRIFPHGNGDGATTAHYPSVAGRVIRGLDSTGVVNVDAENYLGELQADAMQRITGSLADVWGLGGTTSGAFSSGAGTNSRPSGGSGGSTAFTFDSGDSPGARVSDTETRVKAIIAPYIVKVADGADDPAIIAAAQVVADLAAAQADIAALQSRVDDLEWVHIAAEALTSGTSKTYPFPSGVQEVVISVDTISIDTTANLLAQLADAGGTETAGYLSTSIFQVSTSDGNQDSTAGFVIQNSNASHTLSGHIRFMLEDPVTNRWSCEHFLTRSAGGIVYGTGSKSLSAELTDIILTSSTGTANFDGSGTIRARYRK